MWCSDEPSSDGMRPSAAACCLKKYCRRLSKDTGDCSSGRKVSEDLPLDALKQMCDDSYNIVLTVCVDDETNK